MNNYLISYDISNDRIRQKIADLLTQKGCVRLQKSVHLAPAYEPKEIEMLKKALQPLLLKTDVKTDSVLCFAVPDDAMNAAWWAGNPDVWEKLKDPPLYNLL